MNRTSIQKAVVLLWDSPLYGVMEQRLESITEVFFAKGPNQFDFQIIQDWFSSLSLPLSLDYLRIGLDLSPLLDTLQVSVMRIVKLVLLQKKIIFYGSPAGQVTQMVTSLYSLLPGALEYSFVPVSSVCRESLLPFNLFHSDVNLFQPYLPIQKVIVFRLDKSKRSDASLRLQTFKRRNHS
jgi:hypothetical protein